VHVTVLLDKFVCSYGRIRHLKLFKKAVFFLYVITSSLRAVYKIKKPVCEAQLPDIFIFYQVENGKAQAANFPFCTIEPNVGIVAVPDPRLEVLSQLSKSQRSVPATVEFVDIAGLVKGASQGEVHHVMES
jgi:hypothetical protein